MVGGYLLACSGDGKQVLASTSKSKRLSVWAMAQPASSSHLTSSSCGCLLCLWAPPLSSSPLQRKTKLDHLLGGVEIVVLDGVESLLGPPALRYAHGLIYSYENA